MIASDSDSDSDLEDNVLSDFDFDAFVRVIEAVKSKNKTWSEKKENLHETVLQKQLCMSIRKRIIELQVAQYAQETYEDHQAFMAQMDLNAQMADEADVLHAIQITEAAQADHAVYMAQEAQAAQAAELSQVNHVPHVVSVSVSHQRNILRKRRASIHGDDDDMDDQIDNQTYSCGRQDRKRKLESPSESLSENQLPLKVRIMKNNLQIISK
jgi:hypothetical protein